MFRTRLALTLFRIMYFLIHDNFNTSVLSEIWETNAIYFLYVYGN
jgi:hypothetical protein